MADKVVLEAEVKSNIGEVSKDASSLAGEFQIMGVSLNSVKAGFTSIGRTAKASFATIKAGLISTGIGAFVVAIGSLVTYFTNTKRGADQLDRALTGFGATVDVLTDRFSRMGEVITLVFSGKFKEAADVAKGVFSGITEEIKNESKAMMDLKQRTQDLRDADMEFMTQKAATRQEIERARLIAEDETKSAKERLENLKKALELEAETTAQELVLAKERMEIQKEEMALSENSAEDEEKLAQLKTQLIETETASLKMRRRVVTEVNALEREILAEEKARHKERMDMFEERKKADNERMGELTKMPRFTQKVNNEITQADNDYFENLFSQREKDKKTQEELEQFKKDAAMRGLQLIEGIAGEGSKVAKAAAVAQATAAGVQSVVNAFNAANANVGLTVASGGTYPYIQAGLAAGFSALQIRKIIAGQPPSNDTGGDLVTPTTPAPEMMSGRFELTGGVKPEPVQAYVISDDVTNNQDKLAAIRRRATI
jgi:hypothetical protein